MIDVVSNLVGEIVEIYEWSHSSSGYSLRGRGTVCAVYVAGGTLMVLVEHNLGWDSRSYSDRTNDGGFESYSLHEGRARVVQRCGRCATWDQKAVLIQLAELPEKKIVWEHKAGEGCKKDVENR